MTAPLPSSLPPECEEPWNAISRAWDEFSGDDPAQWPERERQFAAGLRAQLVTDEQGEAFRLAALKVVEMLEKRTNGKVNKS
jgi:hypothetical protein